MRRVAGPPAPATRPQLAMRRFSGCSVHLIFVIAASSSTLTEALLGGDANPAFVVENLGAFSAVLSTTPVLLTPQLTNANSE